MAGVLPEKLKSMNDQQIIDAIKDPDGFNEEFGKDYTKRAKAIAKEKRKKNYVDIKKGFVDNFEERDVYIKDLYERDLDN